MLFSERKGWTIVREALQVGSLDTRSRTAIWNALHRSFWLPTRDRTFEGAGDTLEDFLLACWDHFFGIALDKMAPLPSANVAALRKWFFDEETPWYRVLDLIEFICAAAPP